jgi:membrane protein implicated in regulation of membrane protease activity
MDKFTLTLVMTAGVVVLLGILWFTWKYHFRLFKYLLAALIFFAAVTATLIYRLQPVPPKRNPTIGKHAYMKQTGEYLGVVEGSARDRQRGEVWIVRPPGGYQLMYGKSRLTLRDEDDNGKR